jgi:hypothetical protein
MDTRNPSSSHQINYLNATRHHGEEIPQDRITHPIFIVGCGHSGTSLLLAVLGAHSNIHPIPFESSLGFFDRPQEMLNSFAELTVHHGKQRWIEKTPKHVRCMDVLLTLCPEAQVLVIVRDGRDVACSIQDRCGNLQKGIVRWVEDNTLAKGYLGHPRIHFLKYEDLIVAFDRTMSETLEFLGESFEPEIREYHKSPRQFYSDRIEKPPSAFGANHEQYRNWQINQPLFDGRGKWKRMSKEEKDLVKKIGGKLLIEFGYVEDSSW